VTVTVAMRTVGLLLVSALMVVPVATAQQLTRTFRSTLFTSLGIGSAASVGGLLISVGAPVAPGATIVLLAIAGFACTFPIGVWIRRRRRATEPFSLEADPFLVDEPHTVVPEEHGHEHGPDCGHAGVEHGDHVDYVHDGHRHAPHGAHYDEH
jgi:zinc transport system permease protein